MNSEHGTGLQTRDEQGTAAGPAGNRPAVRPQPAPSPAVEPGPVRPAMAKPEMANPAPPTAAEADVVEVQNARFQQLETRKAEPAGDNLGRLMDVVVSVTVELGGTELRLREVLDLGAGSIVKLNRVIGDAVDVHVNRELVAHGEVVVIDDRFGIRITRLVRSEGEAS